MWCSHADTAQQTMLICWSRWFVCATCGDVRKRNWALLTLTLALISLFFLYLICIHFFLPASGAPKNHTCDSFNLQALRLINIFLYYFYFQMLSAL